MRYCLTLGAFLTAVTTVGCGTQVVSSVDRGAPDSRTWAAQVIQPAITPIVLEPGEIVIIVIQELPVDGLFLGGPAFLDGFDGLNPNFVACNDIINVFNNGLTAPPIGFPSAPTINLELSPLNFGSCVLPLNLGLSGSIFLSITVQDRKTLARRITAYGPLGPQSDREYVIHPGLRRSRFVRALFLGAQAR